MSDAMKAVDPWFLNIAVIILAAYFLWSIKGLFKDLKDSINELKKLITDLYEHRNNHESRLTALETKCSYMHEGEYHPQRQSPGRRAYDPPQFPEVPR